MTPKTLPEAIFDKHYAYYSKVGIETIKQQAGQAEQISADYEGRVIYELLQNAFDKAESKVLVKVEGNMLYVANDGDGFTYMMDYDYDGDSSLTESDPNSATQSSKVKRGDFQSLCSISTSSKDANTSIGNKGVGFKSVFSIAKAGFVDVLTLGKIIDPNEGKTIEEKLPIGFRIYDAFRDANDLPSLGLQQSHLTILQRRIKTVQLERKERGVPGYYFPIPQKMDDEDVVSLLDKGYVTIVRVPLDEHGVEQAAKLFEEIKNVHFRFVPLRVDKPIVIDFQFEERKDLCFSKALLGDEHNGLLVTYAINDPRIRDLATAANIQLDSPQVAIYIRDPNAENRGKLYNYLPTTDDSPFVCVDFHADFHTSINRRSVLFGGKIGEYNKALFEACIELYLLALVSSLPEKDRPTLFTKWIETKNIFIPYQFEFDWRFITPQYGWAGIKEIKRVLNLNLWSLQVGTDFLACLAAWYFSIPREKKLHSQFFSVVLDFLDRMIGDDRPIYRWTEESKRALAARLIVRKTRIIPSETEGVLGLSVSKEIIIREKKKEDQGPMVPDFIGIRVSSFTQLDWQFRRVLGLKEYSNRGEILKHFRQVSPSGEFHGPEKPLTDVQQQNLLICVADFLGPEDERLACTHRYDGFIDRPSGSDNTAANFADFALSTIFLRIKNKKYRPAQLCTIDDIDPSFIPDTIDASKRQTLLNFLGVSPRKSFRFVDAAIYRSFKEDIDYIPRPWQGLKENADPLRHDETIAGILILNKEREFHPAIVNENFSFLKKVDETEIRTELGNLLAKNYSRWPKPYAEKLLVEMDAQLANVEEVMRLYYLVCGTFAKIDKFLVINQNRLRFSEPNTFKVANNLDEFAFLRTVNFDLLALQRRPQHFQLAPSQFVKIEDGDIFASGTTSITKDFNQKIQSRIAHLLVAISRSNLSTKEYLTNRDHITQLRKRLLGMEFVEADQLEQTKKVKEPAYSFSKERPFAFEEAKNILYFKTGASITQKAEAVASYVLEVPTVSVIVNMVLFRQTDGELETEYSKEEREIIQRAWDPDYEKKWRTFQIKIFKGIGIKPPNLNNRWFVHSAANPSETLCAIAELGKMDDLRKSIEMEKANSSGLFLDFEVHINNDDHLPKIGELVATLEKASTLDADLLIEELKGMIVIPFRRQYLLDMELRIRADFPELFDSKPTSKQQTAAELAILKEEEIRKLLATMDSLPATKEHVIALDGASTLQPIPIIEDRTIHTGGGDDFGNSTNKVDTGNKGELRALGIYIKAILELTDVEKRVAIAAMENALKEKLSATNTSRLDYITTAAAKCMQALEDRSTLRIALVNLMYVARHFPKAFFDLIGYKDGGVKFVEVKATITNPGDRDSFPISLSEVNAARCNESYEIVRVTPTDTYFLGNPFWNKEEQFNSIHSSQFAIKPSGYVFEFQKR